MKCTRAQQLFSLIVCAAAFIATGRGAAGAPTELAWMRTWNDDVLGYDQVQFVAADAAGHVYVVAVSNTFMTERENIVAIQFDGEGNLVWQRTYDGGVNQYDEPNDIAIMPNGDLAVSGSTSGLSTSESLLLRYDSKGNLIWEKRFFLTGQLAHFQFVPMDVDTEGRVALCARNEEAYLVLVYDAAGNLLFDRTHDTEGGSDFVNDVAFTSTGNVVVTGQPLSPSPGGFRTVAWNMQGEFQWMHDQPGDFGGVTGPARLGADAHGNIIVNGQPETLCGTHENRTWMLDTNGEMVWERVHPLGECASQVPRALAVTSHGEAIVGADAGVVMQSEFGIDTMLFAADGELQWVRRFAEPEPTSSQPNVIMLDAFDSSYVAGVSSVSTNPGWNNNLALLKYARNGRLVWSVVYDSGMNDFAYDIALGPNHEIYVVGEGGIDGVFGNIIARYDQTIPAADLTGEGLVDVFDLLELLGAWGPCTKGGPCPADLDASGRVDLFDLLALLAEWG